MSRQALCRWLLSGILTLFAAAASSAAEVVLDAVRDGTLYEDPAGDLANGAGDYLFTGNGNALKRTLVAFDLTAIPPGSSIESVELTLTMSRTIVSGQTNRVHRVTTTWGEGLSDAGGPEGAGTASEAGDATWIHTFFPTTFWASAGGDFVALASAETLVGDTGDYTFGSTPELIADVEGWLVDPTTNHGWAVLGPESLLFRSAKRFNSRTHPDVATRPRLRVVFTAPAVAIPTLDLIALGTLVLMLMGAGWLRLRH